MPETAVARRIFIRWQALWQLWVGIAVALYGWRQVIGRSPATWAEAGAVAILLAISSLLITLLALLLKPEPLLISIKYGDGSVTYYRLGLPFRIMLPLSRVHCQFSEQANHSGGTHFLIVYGAQGQAWTIQESNGWPLARLKLVHELLEAEVA